MLVLKKKVKGAFSFAIIIIVVVVVVDRDRFLLSFPNDVPKKNYLFVAPLKTMKMTYNILTERKKNIFKASS